MVDQVSRICHPEPRVLDCLKTIIAQVLGIAPSLSHLVLVGRLASSNTIRSKTVEDAHRCFTCEADNNGGGRWCVGGRKTPERGAVGDGSCHQVVADLPEQACQTSAASSSSSSSSSLLCRAFSRQLRF